MTDEPKRQRRRTETPIDRFIRAYLELAPIERPLAMAALRGADLALGREARGNGAAMAKAQSAFEELGASIAAETESA